MTGSKLNILFLSYLLKERLVREETVVPCRWRSETLKLGIKEVFQWRNNEANDSSGTPSFALTKG